MRVIDDKRQFGSKLVFLQEFGNFSEFNNDLSLETLPLLVIRTSVCYWTIFSDPVLAVCKHAEDRFMENDNLLKVGCCGFGMRQSKYTAEFETVEIQQTFYQPPKRNTLLNWRTSAPASFDFAIKAWQLITHTSKSPTYRRLRSALTAREASEAGNFRSTVVVNDAWQVTLECAEALNASYILFQCPASFNPTEINLENMRAFFSSIERPRNRLLCWEPRGASWTNEVVSMLCEELGLLHVVDPFVSRSVTPENFYYRLHGRTGWRHDFDLSELETLSLMVPANTPGRVYFNNARMVEDASTFKAVILAR